MTGRTTLRRIRRRIQRRLKTAVERRYAMLDRGQVTDWPEGRYAEMFRNHDGRLCHKWLHYAAIYDRVFGPLAGKPVRFLEIGVQHGGSLELWRKFLGPEATIYGIDFDPRCAHVGGPTTPVRIGSQTDAGFVRSVVEEMGGVDVVLDDGSHEAAHQRASFDALFPLLSEGGLYVIEDTHTSYWFGWGGGIRRPGTAIQMAKGLVDGMHRWYFRTPVGRRSAVARTEVQSVSFYDSIIVIEKASRGCPQAHRVGTASF